MATLLSCECLLVSFSLRIGRTEKSLFSCAWVRYQTRVSSRSPQGVLRFRMVGNCSSERRFVRIVCLRC
jgi:hypothetical protein